MDQDTLHGLAAFAGVTFTILFLGLICAGVLKLTAKFDFDRIRSYIQSRGGHLQFCRRCEAPFSLFTRDHQRHYEVCYADAVGQEHRVVCKTSLFSDVYFTGDCIIAGAKPTPPPLPAARPDVASLKILQEENRQLREEVRRLRSLHDTR